MLAFFSIVSPKFSLQFPPNHCGTRLNRGTNRATISVSGSLKSQKN